MAALSGDTGLAGTFILSPDLYHANPTHPEGTNTTMRYVIAVALFDRDLAETFTLSPNLQIAPYHKTRYKKSAALPCDLICNVTQKHLT